MTDHPHRQQPTEQEKFAAAGAEDYLGVPISDDEFADVWTATPDKDQPAADQPGPARGSADSADSDE